MNLFARMGVAAVSLFLAVSAVAQGYPSKPVKVVVGYAAGGAVDVVARTIGQSLQTSLGQPFVVENKPGAGTNIAVKSVIAAEPDGHTLMMAANALAANMSLYKPQPFDAEKDLTAISLIGRVPVVIAANPNVPYANIQQLIAAAKGKPNSIAYSSPGNGSTPHMAIELFARAAGIDLHVKRGEVVALVGESGSGIGVHLGEHQPRHGQGQRQVESLPADIEDQRLASDQILLQLAEVRLQSDGDERQAEAPVAQHLGRRGRGAGERFAPRAAGGQQRERERRRDEPQHELRKPPPDFAHARPRRLRVALDNGLTEDTTVHWHGIELESYFDGVGEFGGDPKRGRAPMIHGGHDFTALDRIMPHPVYGKMYWVCVLNPSDETFRTFVDTGRVISR